MRSPSRRHAPCLDEREGRGRCNSAAQGLHVLNEWGMMDQKRARTNASEDVTGRWRVETIHREPLERDASGFTRARERAPSSSRSETAEVLAHVQTCLETAAVDAALRYLNARTRFRFTGVFHVDPPTLRNVGLVDRENPTLNLSGAVKRVELGYCGLACGTRTPFVTADAREDERLQTHAARDSVISYAGVPIRLPSGIAWGTLCHFDVRPRLIEPAELPILEAVTPLFAAWIARLYNLS